ncbi:hypothetical protein U9M48_020616 [Paspalum notatum var. saurae]|uniref:Uncharacterized protein n=1 Tax=Paspalum notatum var. saurae TaxID=547442 RepID=A0AAQ3TDQ9_PASNO
MKRTRAQQPKAEDLQQDGTTTNPKPAQQRRAKQPRLPKAGANAAAAAKKPSAGSAVAARAVAAAAEMGPTVPDVCGGVAGEGDAERGAEAGGAPHALDWDLDAAAAAAWWTWGVDEEKLLGWFPFVEEDFRCAGGRAGDVEIAAFDHDIWSICTPCIRAPKRLEPPYSHHTPEHRADCRAPPPSRSRTPPGLPAMKRTRAQQPKAEDLQQDGTTTNPKPAQQRRAKQPRQPKAGANAAAAKKPSAGSAVAARAVAAAAEMGPTVPDVCGGVAGEGDAERGAEAGGAPHALDWDLDAAAAAAWWTWGVDEEKLLGWFPFVEEDFRCAGGRAGDVEIAAFDHDIWSIW